MDGAAERIVIVGGGPAALSAARGYREAGGLGAVTLLSDDDRPPYERPPLSKAVLRGEAHPDDGALREPDWYAVNGVQVRTGARVDAVDRVARHVSVAGRDEPYDRLVLATGGRPVLPDLPGIERAHTLRHAADALALRDAVTDGARVVVVGTGFIGCEAAVSLARRGARVTLVGMEAVPLAARIGTDAGARVRGWIEAEGIDVRADTELTAVESDGATVGEETLPADVVLVAAGMERRTELARDAGLELGEAGIATDSVQRTSDERILAAGDCAETLHPVARRRLLVEHWGDALAQGEAAGRRAAGDAAARWDAVPGFWSQIGDRWLKHAAWGDGWWREHVVDHPGGGWTVWYADDADRCVGVLTHDADDDYDRGRELIAAGEPCP